MLGRKWVVVVIATRMARERCVRVLRVVDAVAIAAHWCLQVDKVQPLLLVDRCPPLNAVTAVPHRAFGTGLMLASIGPASSQHEMPCEVNLYLPYPVADDRLPTVPTLQVPHSQGQPILIIDFHEGSLKYQASVNHFVVQLDRFA